MFSNIWKKWFRSWKSHYFHLIPSDVPDSKWWTNKEWNRGSSFLPTELTGLWSFHDQRKQQQQFTDDSFMVQILITPFFRYMYLHTTKEKLILDSAIIANSLMTINNDKNFNRKCKKLKVMFVRFPETSSTLWSKWFLQHFWQNQP